MPPAAQRANGEAKATEGHNKPRRALTTADVGRAICESYTDGTVMAYEMPPDGGIHMG